MERIIILFFILFLFFSFFIMGCINIGVWNNGIHHKDKNGGIENKNITENISENITELPPPFPE